MTDADTIAAITTPLGKGGIGIIRISGPQVCVIAETLFQQSLQARHASYLPFIECETETILDYGIVLLFKAPYSYTGEDVLELQGHGGPVVLNLMLKQVLGLGARLAEPGEFTLRAFLNDKIDLAQAEAVADLIESSSEQAVRAAAKSLDGRFSELIATLLEKLIHTRMYIEAALDFPEEEIDFLADQELQRRIDELQQQLENIKASVKQGQLLKDGMTIVILGQPNAGKSSLLNVLTGKDSAIVTDIAGTTRDILREHIHLDGLPLHIIDTAGLRDSGDSIEQEGVKRAWAEAMKADRVLLMVDASKGFHDAERQVLQCIPDNLPVDIIFNKIDLIAQSPYIRASDHGKEIGLSATENQGVDLLSSHLKQVMGFEQTSENQFIARQRHMDALSKIEQHIMQAIQQFQYKAGELAAEELRQAQNQLSIITGEFHSDDLLGEIFSGFCIGK